MESTWLRETRERLLAKVLEKHGLDAGQRETIRRLDAHWARRGLSLATRIHYATRGRLFGIWLRKSYEQATRDDIERYLDTFATDHAPITLELLKRFLRVFYRALLAPDSKDYPQNVAWIKQGRTSQMSKRPQDLVTRGEVLRIAGAATTARDRALIMVLHESAARSGELVSLRIGDVEMDAYGARVTLRGKTGMRKVRLIDSVFDLSEWLNVHPLRDHPDAPLFVSWSSRNRLEALRHDGVTRVVNAAVAGARIQKRVHPHLLRHSRLTELAKVLSESELKIFAGWTADSAMAKVYIHLSGDDVDRKILEKRGLLPRDEVAVPDPLASKRCGRCRQDNSPTRRFCGQCRLPLDDGEVKRQIEEHERLSQNEGLLSKLLDKLEDPRVRALLRDSAATPESGTASP